MFIFTCDCVKYNGINYREWTSHNILVIISRKNKILDLWDNDVVRNDVLKPIDRVKLIRRNTDTRYKFRNVTWEIG